MTIKVSDLAKELEVSVDEILDQMRRLFVDAEDESSKVDEIALIRHKFGEPNQKPAGNPLPKAAAKPKKHQKEAVKSGKVRKLTFPEKLTVDETEKIWKEKKQESEE